MFSDGQAGSIVIMGVTVGASLIGLFSAPALIDKSLFRPYWFFRERQYPTLIAHGIVHADVGHLLMNMLTFYFFGFPLERYLGTAPFVILYLVGLVASSGYTWYRHHRNPQYATLGASGAVSAVLFAYIVYDPFSTLYIIPIPIPIPAFLFAVGYLWYTWWAARQQRDRINHDAHLLGALSGVVFVAVTDPGAFQRLLGMF